MNAGKKAFVHFSSFNTSGLAKHLGLSWHQNSSNESIIKSFRYWIWSHFLMGKKYKCFYIFMKLELKKKYEEADNIS